VSTVLEVDSICKSFGQVRAVDNCSFAVEANSITALIGPNGSGKTTVFNLVTGYVKPDSGRVRFDGRDVTGKDAGRMYRRGLSRTFQQARVFPQLTVQENLVVARGYSWPELFARRSNSVDRQRAAELLEEFGLMHVADLFASELSYGQRKLLEFASVLVSDPSLVLLDEPTAGVNPVMIETMERHIRQRHEAGITFLIVEHDMQFVMRLCNPVVVMDRGSQIFAGSPDEVQTNPMVLDAYLGA
jgi:ABC-type branched-subunit amino acid transport system ATPase component